MENPRDQEIAANSAGPADERKLWLDYLRSLNERRLQAAQRSGWTNRVLVAVLAGLLYQFVPHLPKLFAIAGAVQASLVSFILETDAFSYFLFASVLLLYYCAGGVEHRVLPEPRRRSANITMWTILPFLSAFSIFQVWVGIWFDFSSRFVKWSVVILGVWWGFNVFGGAKKQFKAARRARMQRIPIPLFTTPMFAPNWESLVAVSLLLLVAFFASVTLVFYLKGLKIDWTIPLGAASLFLTCFAICAVLFYRGLNLATEATYDNLERDILLDHLDAKEIRSRFIRQTLGEDTTTWLDELLMGLKTEDDNLTRVRDSAQKRLEEVNAIDPQYSTERTARAKNVADELTSAIQQHTARLENLMFQMELFLKGHKTQREHEVLQRWVGDLKTRMEESKNVVLSLRQLLAQLPTLSEKHT